MQLENISIKNLFCYDHEEINIDQGITTVLGPNGSGKSSFIESIFFALYGSTTKKITGKELDDILKIGKQEAQAHLTFHHDGESGSAVSTIQKTGDDVSSDSKNCMLRINGEEWSGVRDMTTAVQNMLNMSAEDFARAVYVRQGDVKSLITASSSQRQEMFDGLLQLDLLNRYYNRTKEGARRAVNRELDVVRGMIQNLREKLDNANQEDLEQSISDKKDQVSAKRNQIEQLEDQRDHVVDEMRDLRELKDKKQEIVELKAKVENKYQRKKEKAESLGDINIEKLEEKKEEVDPGHSKDVIERSIETLNNKLEEARSNYQEYASKVKSLEDRIDEKQNLIDQGKCPTCGADKKSFNTGIEGLKEKLDEYKQKRDKFEDKGHKLSERLEKAREAKEQYNQLEKIEQKIDSQKEKKSNLIDQIDDIQQDIEDLQGEFEDIQSELGDLDRDVDEEMQQLRSKKQSLTDKMSTLQSEVDDITNEIGKAEAKIEQIKELEQQLDDELTRKGHLDELKSEVEDIKKTYKQVKQSLRETNLKALNSYTNKYFQLMNTRQAYQGVEITQDYDISIEARHTNLQPHMLSGGEQALLNLCIRAAVHQILEKGVGSSLPLLLDEPTVFLDAEHITPLQKLLEQLEQEDNQVLMVTHNQELSEIASTILETIKHDDNNSEITKVSNMGV